MKKMTPSFGEGLLVTCSLALLLVGLAALGFFVVFFLALLVWSGPSSPNASILAFFSTGSPWQKIKIQIAYD